MPCVRPLRVSRAGRDARAAAHGYRAAGGGCCQLGHPHRLPGGRRQGICGVPRTPQVLRTARRAGGVDPGDRCDCEAPGAAPAALCASMRAGRSARLVLQRPYRPGLHHDRRPTGRVDGATGIGDGWSPGLRWEALDLRRLGRRRGWRCGVAMAVTASNWMESLRTHLEPSLACVCGAENSPHVVTIHILNSHGQAACDQCGRGGAVQLFTRPLKGHA
jgi:hypothetical protein